jgi:hypothetical protein
LNSEILKAPLFAGLALWAGLAIPYVRIALETRLTTHVLIELLGLAVAGYLIGIGLRPVLARRLRRWNRFGLSGLAMAISCGAVWMLPRWLDASLDSVAVETAKFTSLPLLLGVPLALSWPELGTIGRGFIKTNFLSMLLFFGWLYIASPVRLCNSYLIDDQTLLGVSFIVIAGVLSLLWSVPLFIGNPAANRKISYRTSHFTEDKTYAVRPID